MSRKDYVAIASMIAELDPSIAHDALIDALCSLYKHDKQAFDKRRFIAACAIYHKGRTE